MSYQSLLNMTSTYVNPTFLQVYVLTEGQINHSNIEPKDTTQMKLNVANIECIVKIRTKPQTIHKVMMSSGMVHYVWFCEELDVL